jgi:hypothetical protein
VSNKGYAFSYPALNINAHGTLGLVSHSAAPKTIQIAPSASWRPHVVWYQNGSDKTLTRWGDYITVRAGTRNRALFSGFGYFAMKSSIRKVGYLFNPFYVRFEATETLSCRRPERVSLARG